MSSIIISSASRSSPRIFIYHSSHIILIPSSFYSIILAFFTFPLIHFTMVLFAISSKLIFTHFIYHTLLFIIPSSFPSYFTSITLITTHPCFSFLFASMYFIHSFWSIPISFFLSATSIILTPIHFHSNTLIPSNFIIPIHFQFLFWLFILTRSVVPPPLHCLSLTFILSNPIPIPLFCILYILFISFLRFLSSFLNYEFYTMFVRIVVIALSFVVLIGNTLGQLDVTAFASDDWFKSSGIEWWGNGRMRTWGLEGIGVLEAIIAELHSTVC